MVLNVLKGCVFSEISTFQLLIGEVFQLIGVTRVV